MKTRMILTYCLIIIFILAIITAMSISSFNEISNNKTDKYTFEILGQVKKNIDYYINDMEQIARNTNSHYQIQSLLKAEPDTVLENYESAYEVKYYLDTITTLRNDIEAILLIGNNGYTLANDSAGLLNPNYNFTRQSWYRKAVESPDEYHVTIPHKQNYIQNSDNLVFSLFRRINSFSSNEKLGAILIDLNLDVLDRICKSVELDGNGYIMIVDNNGNFIYHPDYSYMYRAWDELYVKDVMKSDDNIILQALGSESGTFQRKNDGVPQQIHHIRMPSTDWTIISITPRTGAIKEQRAITSLIMFYGLIGILIAVIFTFFIADMIFNPITKLRRAMAKTKKGNINISLDIKRPDEIGELYHSFNQMMLQIKNLMTKVKDEEEEKRKAELRALQAQINPHFLYNTLDSIIWMAECNRKEVVTMVDALSKLFRLSLSKGKQIIKIGDEIEHVRNYLIIQCMRYTNKLSYKIDVSEDILSYSTLKLILQPLVENSIYHGIKNKRSPGLVTIRGKMVDGNILIEVADDGIGMSKEKLETVLSVEARNENNSSSGMGMGVKNVNERIKLYFGNEYGLEYSSTENVGTVVSVRLPAIKADGDENA